MKSFKTDVALRLTGFMLLVSVVPVLLSHFISYATTRQSVIQLAIQHNLQLLGNQRDYLNLQTDQIEALAENPAWVVALRRVNEARRDGSAAVAFNTLALKARIGELLSGYSGLNGLDSIDLYNDKGEPYHFGEPYDSPDENSVELTRLLANAWSSPERAVTWHGVLNGSRPSASGRKLIVASRRLREMGAVDAEPTTVGVLRINLSAQYLHDHFSRLALGHDEKVLLVDAKRQLLVHPDFAQIGQVLPPVLGSLLKGASGTEFVDIEDGRHLVSYLEMPEKQWYILSLVPEATLNAPMVNIERTGLLLLVVSLLAIFLVLRTYFHQVIEPIRSVIHGFRDFQANRLKPGWRLQPTRNWIQLDELMNLFNAFLETMMERQKSEAELRVAAVAFEAQDGIVVTDANNVVLKVNPAFCQITGYAAPEIIGHNMTALKSGRHDKAFYEAIWARLHSEGFWSGEVWNRIKNGEVHPHWLTISTVRDQNHTITHFVATYTDITERKQAEAEMRRMNDELESRVAERTAALAKALKQAEAASKAKSEFLSSMSHELRTPLNSVLGYAQLFATDPLLNEEQQENAREIERAGTLLLNLVNDVLDLSRIESGRMQLSMVKLKLDTLIASSFKLVAGQAEEAHIKLVDAGGDGCGATLFADEQRLQQVLLNFLTNAIKYNRPHGRVTVSCKLAGVPGRQTVRIEVADTGRGIPLGKQSRLFHAFDRLGLENGAVEGTGIGLLISKRIVEAMDGTIGFASTEGEGSVFWAEFPVLAESGANPHVAGGETSDAASDAASGVTSAVASRATSGITSGVPPGNA